MASVEMIPEEEATGQVKEIYKQIKTQLGIDFVPNLYKTMAVKPDYLEANWHKVNQVMVEEGKLDRLTKEIIADGRAKVVALTLGDEGALLVTEDRIVRLPTPKVDAQSTVGAGDSFVGGLTLGLAGGWSLEDAFALGISCGAATVLTAGTELCHLEDIERFFEQITGYAMPRFG